MKPFQAMNTRRRILVTALALGAGLHIGEVHAQGQTFPTKPITIVVPAAGGAPDIFARLLAPKLTELLGQPIVVEARPGAGGNVAAAAVARAEPDGHTIMMHSSLLAISPSIYKSLTFSPRSDFAPISQIAATEMVILVNPASPLPIKSLKELVSFAKENPKKLNYASAGSGTIIHLASEMFKKETKTDIIHVPYKGSAPGLMALMANQVQMSIDVLPVALPHIKGGKLKALAIASPQRSSLLPDVPTTAEAGLPDYLIGSWNGLFAPAKTPAHVIGKLSDAIRAAASTPEFKDKLVSLGAVPMATSATEFRAFFDGEISKFAKVVEEAGITVDQ